MSAKTGIPFVFFLIALSFFIQLNQTLAIEGTCSWHGGINCNAGTDWDGSAICNDGWRDSSETYISTKICEGVHHFCSEAEARQLDIKYSVPEKQKRLDELNAQMQPYIQKALLYKPFSSQTQNTSELRQDAIDSLTLSSEVQAAQADLRFATGQAEKECYALGDTAYYQQQAAFYKQLQSSQIQPQQIQSTLSYNCPSNLVASGNKCVCNDGYIWDGGACITYTQSCQAQLGSNSYGDKQRCYCSTGYQYDASKTSCAPIPQTIIRPQSSYPPPQPPSFPDPIEFCIQKLGPHGIVAGQNLCGCVAGYMLNEQKNNCIPVPTPTTVTITTATPEVSSSPKTETAAAVATKGVQIKPAVPVVKKQEVKKTTEATATLQATTTSSQEVISTQKLRAFWSKLISPVKSFWGRIF